MNIEDRNAYANAIEGTFNPLLKVLCTFPLWYLSAIGFGKLISFARSLPCHSHSSPKEHNSAIMECMSVSACVEKGSHLLFRPFQKCSHSIQPITHQCGTFFIAEVLYTGSLLFIRHYLEYHLHFLLPPLTYMLKFSRFLHQFQTETNKDQTKQVAPVLLNFKTISNCTKCEQGMSYSLICHASHRRAAYN